MSTLFRIAAAPGHADGFVGRAGGVGVGVPEEHWPRFDGKPMQHLITVLCDSIVVGLPPHVAAVAVFISAFDKNEAWEPDTEETSVLFLSHDDLELPSFPEAPIGAPEHVLAFDRIEYELASIVEQDDDDEPTPLDEMDDEELGRAVAEWMAEQRGGTVGEADVIGLSTLHVDWCQAPEAPEGHRVLFYICDDCLPNTNFGSGFLYVTANDDATEGRAWWQC